jgi:hypothetical protein
MDKYCNQTVVKNVTNHSIYRDLRRNWRYHPVRFQPNTNYTQYSNWNFFGKYNRLTPSGLNDWLDNEHNCDRRRMEVGYNNRFSWGLYNLFNIQCRERTIASTRELENRICEHTLTINFRTCVGLLWNKDRVNNVQKCLKGDDPQSPTESEKSADQEEKDSPAKFLCSGCNTFIAFMSDTIKVDDIPTLSAQINPYGFVHEVITVCYVTNVFLHGSPEPADSWFPGYFWRYIICVNCNNHIGWSYHRAFEDKMTFAGLRKSSIIES